VERGMFVLSERQGYTPVYIGGRVAASLVSMLGGVFFVAVLLSALLRFPTSNSPNYIVQEFSSFTFTF